MIHTYANMKGEDLTQTQFVESLLPSHYSVKENIQGCIRCNSHIGIDDELKWKSFLDKVKEYFGQRHKEIYHSVYYNHKNFTVYYNPYKSNATYRRRREELINTVADAYFDSNGYVQDAVHIDDVKTCMDVYMSEVCLELLQYMADNSITLSLASLPQEPLFSHKGTLLTKDQIFENFL